MHLVIDDEELEEEVPKKKEDVHVPAKNIGEIRKAEKVHIVLCSLNLNDNLCLQIREKLELMRESRNLAKKLAGVQGLGKDTGGAQESTSDWVQKMRDKEKEKKLAEQRVRHTIHVEMPLRDL